MFRKRISSACIVSFASVNYCVYFQFVYNDGVRERCFLSCHEHGTKKKILVHMRN